ncbi:MAG TPA: PQQ-binding-like beta-propeller repeat protein [Planctomycetota bacterium]|nr:PQQ-binding-like beta-propeller repeat protein [Planctomycetota bacterium]
MKTAHIFLLIVLAASSVAFCGENWPQWRGPNHNGSSGETGLPDKLDKDSTLVWTTPLPGRSGATPVVWNDKVFLTAGDKTNKDLLAICVNRADGKVLWQKVVAPSSDKPYGKNSNMASPSPITDGKSVIFLFGTGHLAAFDMDGKELWTRDLTKDHSKFAIMWGYGSSGMLYKDKLYIPVLQRDTNPYVPGADSGGKPIESFILCIDPKTGKELWKHVRPSDAVQETRESYATPIPLELKDRSELVMVGGDCVSGHDPETGKEYWRFGGWNPTKINHVRLVPSVTTWQDLVFVSTPKHLFPFFAVKAGGSGDVTNSHQAWSLDKSISPDVCTPLVYKDLLYVLDGDSGKRMLYCIDPKTGTKKWEGQIPGAKSTFWTSPTAADDKIYVINEASEVSVIQAGGSEFKVLNMTSMGDTICYSSIAIAQGQLFVRTGQNLHCFAKK